MPRDALTALVGDLRAAHEAAASAVGETPIGVRAVQPTPTDRWYLCAFPGPRFLCLDAALVTAEARRDVERVAGCTLLVEHAESLLDASELAVVATLSARLGGAFDGELAGALGALATRAEELRRWREAPDRAVASVPHLDRAVQLHDATRTAYTHFLEASEPLVARQDTLEESVVGTLRDLEQTAGRAGLLRALAAELAEAMPALDAGAREIADAHLAPLDDGDAA